ncbi:MAG: hypothetical protein V4730_04500 [Pseudomonadota bacterium]
MDKSLKKFVVELPSDNAFVTGLNMLEYLRMAAIYASYREGADIEGGDVDLDLCSEQFRFLQAAAKNKEFTFLNADKYPGRKLEFDSKIEVENAQKYLKGIGIELRLVAPLTDLENKLASQLIDFEPKVLVSPVDVKNKEVVSLVDYGGEYPNDGVRPMGRERSHAENILNAFSELGFDPHAVPVVRGNIGCVKSKVKSYVLENYCWISKGMFEKAWQCLRDEKAIQDAN